MNSIIHTIRLVTSAATAIAEIQKYQRAIIDSVPLRKPHVKTRRKRITRHG